MKDEEVEENLKAVISAICAHRNAALGPFVNRCLLTLIPSKTFVPVDVSQYLPVATEEQIEKVNGSYVIFDNRLNVFMNPF